MLCGGAINSPQLLQLWGVGNANEQNVVGVGVIHDLRIAISRKWNIRLG
jgi:choline dehydrogenase